jgi:predicted carbohydrate-binding protein with CBM5 and CBM33 domain
MKSFALAAIVPLVAGHGYIVTPSGRVAGDAMAQACGQQIATNQESDQYGNIQGEMQLISTDFDAAACNLWQCKGMQFSDNPTANIQSYTAGEVVAMTYDIRAPHTGYANVSVVDTASNSVIGEPLISWDVFASTGTGITADELNFSVTIPDLGGKCTTPGECVIQHFWHSDDAGQTYEACIDFSIGGDSGSAPTSSAVSSAAATSSTAIASSVVTSSAVASSAVTSSAAPTTLATVTTPASPPSTPTPTGGSSCSAKKRRSQIKKRNARAALRQ